MHPPPHFTSSLQCSGRKTMLWARVEGLHWAVYAQWGDKKGVELFFLGGGEEGLSS